MTRTPLAESRWSADTSIDLLEMTVPQLLAERAAQHPVPTTPTGKVQKFLLPALVGGEELREVRSAD